MSRTSPYYTHESCPSLIMGRNAALMRREAKLFVVSFFLWVYLLFSPVASVEAALIATPTCNGSNPEVSLSWSPALNSIGNPGPYFVWRDTAMIASGIVPEFYLDNTGVTGGASHDYVVTPEPNIFFNAQTATVFVPSCAPPSPSCIIGAAPGSIANNETSTLSWTTSNALSCSGSGSWSGSKSLGPATQTVGPLAGPGLYDYILICFNGPLFGSCNASVSVAGPGVPVVDLQVENPIGSALYIDGTASRANGQTAELRWQITSNYIPGVTQCNASGDWFGSRAASAGWSPPQTQGPLSGPALYSYVIQCSNDGYFTLSSDFVSISVSAPPPPGILFDGMTLNGEYSEVAMSGAGTRASAINTTSSQITFKIEPNPGWPPVQTTDWVLLIHSSSSQPFPAGDTTVGAGVWGWPSGIAAWWVNPQANNVFTVPLTLGYNYDFRAQICGSPLPLTCYLSGAMLVSRNSLGFPLPQCSNTFDDADPEDTLADAADPGCRDALGNYVPLDNDETDALVSYQCSNGVDDPDPEDFLADALDPGCRDALGNYVPTDNDETDLVSLSVVLVVTPPTGAVPLTVDATANVGGLPTTPIRYDFDCTNDGIFELGPFVSLALTYTTQCNYVIPGTYTMRVRATDIPAGTTAFDTETVTALPSSSPATVNLQADCGAGFLDGPLTVANNTACTLRWITGGTTPISCTAGGSWSGGKSGAGGTQGMGILGGPAAYSYDISCSNVDGSDNDNVTVAVLAPLPPGPPSNPNPAHLSTNISVFSDLFWTAGAGATNRDVYFGICPALPLAGNTALTQWLLPTLNYTTQYCWQIIEKNSGGSTAGPVWSFTTENPLPPACTLSAGNAAILQGQSVALSWNCTSPVPIVTTLLTANPPPSIGPVPPIGSQNVSPSQTTIYTVTATNAGGSGSASVTVGVYIQKIREVIPEL